jgi:hypothetical protein
MTVVETKIERLRDIVYRAKTAGGLMLFLDIEWFGHNATELLHEIDAIETRALPVEQAIANKLVDSMKVPRKFRLRWRSCGERLARTEAELAQARAAGD